MAKFPSCSASSHSSPSAAAPLPAPCGPSASGSLLAEAFELTAGRSVLMARRPIRWAGRPSPWHGWPFDRWRDAQARRRTTRSGCALLELSCRAVRSLLSPCPSTHGSPLASPLPSIRMGHRCMDDERVRSKYRRRAGGEEQVEY